MTINENSVAADGQAMYSGASTTGVPLPGNMATMVAATQGGGDNSNDNFTPAAPDTRAYRLQRAEELLAQARDHERLVNKDPGRRRYHEEAAVRLRAQAAALIREPTVVQTETTMHYANVPHPGRMPTPHEEALAHIHGGSYSGVEHKGEKRFHTYRFKTKAAAGNFAAAHHKAHASGAHVDESAAEPPVQDQPLVEDRRGPIIAHTDGLRDAVVNAVWRGLAARVDTVTVINRSPTHATFEARLSGSPLRGRDPSVALSEILEMLHRSGRHSYAFEAVFDATPDGQPVLRGRCVGTRMGAIVGGAQNLAAGAASDLAR